MALSRGAATLSDLNAAERVAAALVLTVPVALVADFRLDLVFIRDTITYSPFLENAGRAATYEQSVGVTQLVTVLSTVAAAATPIGRRGFVSWPALCLLGFMVFVLLATGVQSRLDTFTLHAALSTLFPIWCISVVVCNPALRVDAIRALVSVLSAIAGLAVLATIGKSLVLGTPLGRHGVFLFGSPTGSGAALAVLLVLTLLGGWGSWRTRAAVAIPLCAGLLLSETRGAVLAVVIGIGVAALLIPRWRWRCLAASGVLIVAFTLFSDRSLTSITDPSNSLRRETLEHHYLLLRQEPLLGYGLSGEGAHFFRGTDNTLLGLANAAGIGAVLVWLAAWFGPLGRALLTHRVGPAHAIGAGGLVAALVTWNTTGNEVLIYSAPTNLLPVALAVAFTAGRAKASVSAARPAALGRLQERASTSVF